MKPTVEYGIDLNRKGQYIISGHYEENYVEMQIKEAVPTLKEKRQFINLCLGGE